MCSGYGFQNKIIKKSHLITAEIRLDYKEKNSLEKNVYHMQ